MTKHTSSLIIVGAGCLALTCLFGPMASATVLFNDPADAITLSNSQVQDGRISRDDVPQTWTPALDGETSYPGAINTTTPYNYVDYTFSAAQIGNGQFVQIDISEPTGIDLFASAWTSYDGTSSVASGTGWLGDAGASGNYGPNNALFFNVTVPVGDGLTVVVNTTDPAAIGEGFSLEVEDFSTTSYTKATPLGVPEPGTWAMLGAGALLGGLAMFRRRNQMA